MNEELRLKSNESVDVIHFGKVKKPSSFMKQNVEGVLASYFKTLQPIFVRVTLANSTTG